MQEAITRPQQAGGERTIMPTFIETETSKTIPPWCVDGRPDTQTLEKGAQMLGASLHPVALKAIFEDTVLEDSFLGESLAILRDQGFALGAHRGAHQHEDKSDCGFADRLSEVIRKAQQNQGEIISRLLSVFDQGNNPEIFQAQGITRESFSRMIGAAYTKINAYDLEKLTLTGEPLIASMAEKGAQLENLTGDHQEHAAFINLKTGTTLDTNRLNDQGQQAFNLDLWAAIDQTEALGVERDFALASSLILYQATEMVLVEDRGKEALPVIIHR